MGIRGYGYRDKPLGGKLGRGFVLRYLLAIRTFVHALTAKYVRGGLLHLLWPCNNLFE